MNVVANALDELYRCFNILNRDKFDGTLIEPVITIQAKRGTYGHFTLDKVWKNVEDNEENGASFYEINLNPCYFDERGTVGIVTTLLHEMVHYRNRVNDIKDCSGRVHNKKFKTVAEKCGLIVEKKDSIGYGYTYPSDELKEYIENIVCPKESAFKFFRAGEVKENGREKKKRNKSMFKYTCDWCGQTARAKKDALLSCGACNILMKIEDNEEEEN